MTTSPTLTVTVRRKFKASPERVFDAWLNPEIARQFLFVNERQHIIRAEIDARVGGSFLFVAHREEKDFDHIGEYLEIDRPRRLVVSFTVPHAWSEMTRVTIDIVPMGSGCELTLTHEGLPTHLAQRIFEGWTTFLVGLQNTQFGAE